MMLFLFLTLVGPLQAPDSSSRQAFAPIVEACKKANDKVTRHVLDNGLEVYLVPVERAPTVTTMLVYRVGSADEKLDQTGLSHYLEHLMFKGTDKLMPGDIDRITLRRGGANNAFTSEDITAYHFDFAADRWEEALKIEADRMRNLRIDEKHEFEQEKGAVIEELNRGDDQPWELEQKTLLPLLFGPKAPYGHPVIGEKSHVKDATAAVIKAHHDRWYHPNNAVLIVAGGIEPVAALATVQRHLGAIPRGVLPERPKTPTTLPVLPTKKMMKSKFDVTRLVLGYRSISGGHADEAAIDFLATILAEGRTSRLYTRMVEDDGLAAEVSVSHSAGRHPGWLQLQVELLPDTELKEAEEALFEEIEKLRDQPVSPNELERVRRKLLAAMVFEQETVHGRAMGVALGVVDGGLPRLKGYIDAVARVSAPDILRVAKTYLAADHRAMVISRPASASASAKPGSNRSKSRALLHGRKEYKQSQPAIVNSNPLGGAKKVVLPNGMVVWLLERRGLPVIAAGASWHDLRLYEPAEKAGLASLTCSLLEEGADGRTAREFAASVEDLGAQMEFDGSGASLMALSKDREKALGLMLAALDRPDFPMDSFEQMREGQLAVILNSEKDGMIRAKQALNRSIYGAKHPLGRSSIGTRATVEALELDDCKSFHARVMTPDNLTLAVVGDFDAGDMEQLLIKLTRECKARKAPAKLKLPAIPAPKASKTFISLPGSAQLQFFMGHAGITRDHPDFHALLVMDHVLGTGPGFTDRLSGRLRDREGLAYTVRAEICSSSDLLPGIFACYIGTDAKNLQRVEAEFLEEIARLRKELATKDEVEDAKSYLLGNLPFRYDGVTALAEQLLFVDRFGWKEDHLERFSKAIAEVTPEMVRAVAQKHILPAKLHLVAAGAIDKNGEPLK